MTPKQKAKELVDRFYLERSRDDLPLTMYWTSAIGCALITIDEIIKSRKDDVGFDDTLWQISDYSSKHPMFLSYWIEVKREIKNL